MLKILVVLISSLLSFYNLKAQEKTSGWRWREKGFLLGMGHGIDSFNLPEGRYDPLFFMGHFGLDILSKTKKQNHPGIFTIYSEPQVNLVFIKKGSEEKTDFEFGLNIGFKHMYPVWKNIYTYILIGTGPHFVTVHSIKQARGFIFSDNFGAGFYFFNNKNIALNTGFRLRHLSNANIKLPNSGINTFNYFIGISKIIR
jgi:hypothetical protein